MRFCLALLLVASSEFAARFEIERLRKLTRVSDPRIAPDGKSLAVIVSRPNYDDNPYDSELVLIDVTSRKQRVLAQGRRSLRKLADAYSGDSDRSSLQIFDMSSGVSHRWRAPSPFPVRSARSISTSLVPRPRLSCPPSGPARVRTV